MVIAWDVGYLSRGVALREAQVGSLWSHPFQGLFFFGGARFWGFVFFRSLAVET